MFAALGLFNFREKSLERRGRNNSLLASQKTILRDDGIGLGKEGDGTRTLKLRV
jgi:hypothetical protein